MKKLPHNYKGVLELVGATVHAYRCFGSYQGDWLAKITWKGTDGWVRGGYGSCSGCDTIQWIQDEIPVDEQEEEFRRIALTYYLDNILTQDDVEAYAKKNLEWDMDAQDMIDFVKENSWNN